jgi:hypothetical protein
LPPRCCPRISNSFSFRHPPNWRKPASCPNGRRLPARKYAPASGTRKDADVPACPRPWCAPAREHAGGANPVIACELLPMPLSFLLTYKSCQDALTSGASPAPTAPNYAAPAFAPALPAFFFSRSPVMRTPFCLYGSGGRSERMSAATWPTWPLSAPLTMRCVCFSTAT